MIGNIHEVYFLYQIEKDGKPLNLKEIGNPDNPPPVRAALFDARSRSVDGAMAFSFREDLRTGMVRLEVKDQTAGSRVTLGIKVFRIQDVKGS